MKTLYTLLVIGSLWVSGANADTPQIYKPDDQEILGVGVEKKVEVVGIFSRDMPMKVWAVSGRSDVVEVVSCLYTNGKATAYLTLKSVSEGWGEIKVVVLDDAGHYGITRFNVTVLTPKTFTIEVLRSGQANGPFVPVTNFTYQVYATTNQFYRVKLTPQ